MISYPINVAKKSKFVDEVFVSTDSQKIFDIAQSYGANVPFLRPDTLSDDYTPTAPVIMHCLEYLIKEGWHIDNVCCIYPCTPLLNHSIVDMVYEKMINSKELFAYPVVQYPHPIYRSMKMNHSSKMQFVFPQNELKRTQDFEICYHDAGQFYWGTKQAWQSGGKMHTDGIGVEIPKWEIIDIDDQDDWKKAEIFMKINFKS